MTGETKINTVETDRGPVEVARAGSGPPVLFIHGSPGGWDTSIAMGKFLVDAGFEVIAPARPGYQGTPLDGRETVDQQADLHAALLDALSIDQTAVMMWSGGGPSGYRLTVRHPERVSALIPFAAVSKTLPTVDRGFEEQLMMNTGLGNWVARFMLEHMRKSMVKSELKVEGNLTKSQLSEQFEHAMQDPAQLAVVLAVAGTVADYKESRRAGVDNDFKQFAAVDTLEIEKITVPTLIVEGAVDTDVPREYSDYAAKTIPGAEQLVIDDGTHLCLFVHPNAQAAQQRVIEKLRA